MTEKDLKDEPQLLNVKKAAAFLGVSPSAIRQWAVSSKLKGLKVGSRGDWRFTKEDLSKMTKIPIEENKLSIIKQFLFDNAEAIEKEATKNHLKYLGPEYLRIEAIQEYMDQHISLFKHIVESIDTSPLERATKIVKKSGDKLAKQAIKDNLTIQEASNGIIYLKQAIWSKLDESGLIEELTTKDYHHLSVTIGTLIDTVSSQIAFSYSTLANKQSEEQTKRLNQLFQQAPAFIAILKGKDHVYEMSNELHYQLVGFRNIIGQPVQNALPEVHSQGIIKLLDSVYTSGKPFVGTEMPVQLQRKKDGQLENRYLNFVYQPIIASDETVTGIFVHGVDVTDQVLARKRTEENEIRYRTLFNSIDEGFCIIEVLFDKHNKPIDYKFIETNIVFEDQTGLKNVIGKKAKELIPNLEQHWIEQYGQVVLTGEPIRFEEGSDAMGRWFNVYATRVGGNESKKVAVIFNDITKRKSGENALEAERLRLHDFFKQAPAAIAVIHGPEHVYELANGFYQKVFNRSEKDLLGKPMRKVFPEINGQGIFELFDTVYETGEAYVANEFPATFDRVGNGTFETGYFSFVAQPIIETGRVQRILIHVIEVTEQLYARNRIEELSKQKDEFIGIASHELKTPVTSIKAYTQLLQHRFQKNEDSKSAEMLGKMNYQLDKLTSLIGDLLDVTKIEGGKLQFNERFFDFNELVDEIVEEMQRTSTSHTLVKKLAPTKSIYGDRDRIGQVITNFLTNAIKYSPTADKVIIKSIIDKENITLCVQDFGVGISKDDQEKVFGRFYRVSGDKQETYPGLGLGLYITAEIIKRQNGKIWVESEKGTGSTFCFSLPLTKKR
jgi:PAS domain S-box-containing protein